MKIEIVAAEAEAGPKAAIAVLAAENTPLAGAAALLDTATGGALQRAIDGSRFTGAKGQTNPWLVIFPAAAMFTLLISLNVVADKLRAYFDVSEIKL